MPIAAELIGSVKKMPIRTETMMLPIMWCSSTLMLTRLPKNAINPEIGGPSNRPMAEPEMMVTKGVTIMSTGVFPETSLPTSIAVYAAMNAPSGSPGAENVKVLSAKNEPAMIFEAYAPTSPAAAAEMTKRGAFSLSLTATPIPMPAPVRSDAPLADQNEIVADRAGNV